MMVYFYPFKSLIIYNLQVNFLTYGITAAVKSLIIKLTTQEIESKIIGPWFPFNFKICLQKEKGSKDIYKILNRNNAIPIVQRK